MVSTTRFQGEDGGQGQGEERLKGRMHSESPIADHGKVISQHVITVNHVFFLPVISSNHALLDCHTAIPSMFDSNSLHAAHGDREGQLRRVCAVAEIWVVRQGTKLEGGGMEATISRVV
jgi:hypothetical protein